MIVKIETEISGNFLIKEEFEIFLHPYTIKIRYDNSIKTHSISISKRLLDYQNFVPKVEIKNNQISEIKLPDISFIDDQLNILKHIESFGSIDINITSINWQNCSIEWINEPNEDIVIPIRKYKITPSYNNNNPKLLTADWLWNTIVYRNQLKGLTLPFSFFREGANSFYSFQYQNAFINFYHMLEGFFGNSQYKNEKIKDEFSKSEILKFGIETTLENLININNRHLTWTNKTVKKFDKSLNVEGIIHLLVEYRGKLSHFSLNKMDMKNPFKDKDYESLAFLAMGICIFSSVKLRIDPFRKKN